LEETLINLSQARDILLDAIDQGKLTQLPLKLQYALLSESEKAAQALTALVKGTDAVINLEDAVEELTAAEVIDELHRFGINTLKDAAGATFPFVSGAATAESDAPFFEEPSPARGRCEMPTSSRALAKTPIVNPYSCLRLLATASPRSNEPRSLTIIRSIHEHVWGFERGLLMTQGLPRGLLHSTAFRANAPKILRTATASLPPQFTRYISVQNALGAERSNERRARFSRSQETMTRTGRSEGENDGLKPDV
jgi:hypothetical protein